MTKKNKNLLFAWGAGAIKFYESPVLVVLLLVTSLHDKKYCVNPRYVMEFYYDCPQDCRRPRKCWAVGETVALLLYRMTSWWLLALGRSVG